MEIIAMGAEAIIYREKEVLIKERVKKSYRIPELDIKLRKERTKREARLLAEARRAGINVPKVIEVEEFKIIMEFVPGKKLKDVLNECSSELREKLAYEIGRIVGKMHFYGIVHGDLTTSNMILKDSEIYFIDFGLGFFSSRIEDFATDLSVLKESLKATHNKYLNELWENIISGYRETNPKAEEIMKQLEKVESRGRYIKRA